MLAPVPATLAESSFMLDACPPPRPDPVDEVPQPAQAGYTAFADAPLWDAQRRYYRQQGMDAWASAEVPHYVTSHPGMAKAYAQVVLGFWRDLKAQGMDTGEPLYIIELGAGCGRFAYHFLLQFFAAFDAVRGPRDKACYVMSDLSAATVSQWQRRLHAKFSPFVAQGRLDFAVFDAEADNTLALQTQGICLAPGSLALPPVVIANYVFGSLRQDLFLLDKERLYEGWLASGTGLESSGGLRLDYQKRRISAPAYPRPQWNRLIERYAKDLPPCALLFSSQALDALERLGQLHKGQLLLLSADRGSHGLKALAQQLEPEIVRHGSVSLPVNFHCLATLIEAQGGSCWTSPSEDDGLAILAACWQAPSIGKRDAGSGHWRETGAAAQQALQGFTPNDAYRIKQTLETEAQYLSPEQMLSFLRLSHWDTKVFYLMYPYVYDFLAQLSEAAQQQWYQGLREVWRFHLPIGEDLDLAFDLATLAAELNRWPAAIAWCLQSIEHLDPAQRDEQSLVSVYVNLGICHWQLAAGSEAEACLRKALECAPGSSHDKGDAGEDDPDDGDRASASGIRAQLAALRAWRASCEQLLRGPSLHVRRATPAEPNAVFASLLGSHQAQALYRLQRHPALCQLAGVECLQSTSHARAWIQHEQSRHKQVLAILHPDLGLIGVAALEFPPAALDTGGSRSARFYYWIGRDYQNQGYGAQALALLQQLAGMNGLAHMFSMVGDSNMASRRALAKFGGQRLPFVAVGEPPGCCYHHVGRAASAADLHGALSRLLVELGSDTSLAPLAIHGPA